MAIETKQLTRVFIYNGVRLPDPGAGLSADAVKNVFSATYAELTNASVDGPQQVGNELQYTFTRVVRDKGGA